MEIFTSFLPTPIGKLVVRTTNSGVLSVLFDTNDEPMQPTDCPLMREALAQLSAYFAGKLTTFSLPLQPVGTAFQQEVWSKLQEIPYGKTISYAKLAQQLGNPKVIRAAAAANGKNPISIIIPCHRVIGQNGQLVGYAGGLERKNWLLNHENVAAHGVLTLF